MTPLRRIVGSLRAPALVLIAILAMAAASSTPTMAAGPEAAARQGAAGSRPDIVVIMIDDLPGDVMPGLLRRMPNLGSTFAEHGVRFPHAYAQDPLCCPSRAGFLTGLTSRHTGVHDNDGRLFDPRVTIATALDAVGYHTMIVGKYLNMTEDMADQTPPGWDQVAIAGGGYYNWMLRRQGQRIWHGSSPSDYSTDVFADQSVTWLREAPRTRPRFVYLAPYATHGDPAVGSRVPTSADRHQGDPRCQDAGFRRTPAWDERDIRDRSAWVQRLDRFTRFDAYDPRGWPLRNACESLLAVDAWFKRVVDVQRAQGRLENTLFVLLADNGMSWGDHRHFAKSVSWTTNVPLYVHWPAVLGTTPAVNPAYVMITDLAPTFAEVAGATLGAFRGGPSRPDGRSLVASLIKGAPAGLWRTALFEEHRDGQWPRLQWSALRTTERHPCGRWHYTEWSNGDRELFDMAADPHELVNRVHRRPVIAQQLHRELSIWKQGIQVTRTVCDAPVASVAGPVVAAASWSPRRS